eukprot:CAMPEP_0198119762 /NCGR_PEP_ID=MMETSP1442-20131203/26916_1 /TAXON_ID= /ORGANISM="Craspedostauros australis, Strain CCMP3328" /LENGTH=46 /DNA_ID= /DNA_START= /DNA_END= /DNA_ORIENTATION=
MAMLPIYRNERVDGLMFEGLRARVVQVLDEVWECTRMMDNWMAVDI